MNGRTLHSAARGLSRRRRLAAAAGGAAAWAVGFDPETHNVVQTVYVRQVREVGPAIHNVAFGTLGVFKDPGA